MDKMRILLADDHAVVRTGIGKALSEVDDLEIVGEVGDGPALFAALARLHPDMLLVDVAMPDFETVADVRRIRDAYQSLKILVVSAYDDDAYVIGLLNAGVDGYHLKDQSLSDLRLAVKRVLAGERWLSSPLVDKLVNRNDAPSVAPSLTARQCDILRWLQQGLDNQAIAQHMHLSVKTVENHLTRLYRQLNVQSRLEAVSYVMQHPEILALPGKEMALATTASETPTQEPITMLLVDDNSRYRRQLRRMVGKVCSQAIICEAGNIGEAIRLVQRVAPRLVLVDVVLGDEDGIGCARRIKALSPASRIVLISAYPDREFHRLGLEAGAVAFLDKKDLDAATLRQVIDDVIA